MIKGSDESGRTVNDPTPDGKEALLPRIGHFGRSVGLDQHTSQVVQAQHQSGSILACNNPSWLVSLQLSLGRVYVEILTHFTLRFTRSLYPCRYDVLASKTCDPTRARSCTS